MRARGGYAVALERLHFHLLLLPLLGAAAAAPAPGEQHEAAQHEGNGTHTGAHPPASVNCKHGTYDPLRKACRCFDGWGTAGITDTLDFFEGVCAQFRCKSDEDCQRVLRIPYATCPVPNWNCYCDFKWAFYNFGHGYETPHGEGGGECMGIMYAFSVWATQTSWWLMQVAWKAFAVAAVLALPFGRKRAICDHHWPSLWNALRRSLGVHPNCTGQCVLQVEYSLDMFKDDLAWTLYILDLWVWSYLFLITLYVVTLFIWSVVLWFVVLLMLVVLAAVGLCAACGEGACGVMDCCACDVAACSCGDCGGLCAMNPAWTATASAGDAFYYSGVFPYDPFWGYSGYGGGAGGCDCCCCCCGKDGIFGMCCRPIAFLVLVFPAVPENAWGGLVGYCFGTHNLTPTTRLYQGGNQFVEFFRMGWRRTSDLHGNDSWRRQVHDFLAGLPESRNSRGRPFETRRAFTQMGRFEEDEVVGNVLHVGRARAVRVDRPFFCREDGCVRSSFEDYKNNHCWICYRDSEEWDLWLSCHHLFCSNCSTEMLQRRMPCPLCRVSSSTVLRGRKYDAEVGGESGSD